MRNYRKDDKYQQFLEELHAKMRKTRQDSTGDPKTDADIIRRVGPIGIQNQDLGSSYEEGSAAWALAKGKSKKDK